LTLDLLWLLLPVAAGSGWWAARLESGQRAPPPRDFSAEYSRGLNYVLNEQPDKAIEIFVRMLESDAGTVDTHLALGNLFRRRGEVDRAIRIHQSLIARPRLGHGQRVLAMQELGMDYLRLGLLDRAENIFKEVVNSGEQYLSSGLGSLLEIYQRERDWELAIATAGRLGAATGRDVGPVIAQFQCERAEVCLERRQEKEARECLRQALASDPCCVRASLLAMRMHRDRGEFRRSLAVLHRVEQQDPDYLPEAIPPLLDCYERLGERRECIEYLRGNYQRCGSPAVLHALVRLLAEEGEREHAVRFLSGELKRRPSIQGIDQLLEYVGALARGATREGLQAVCEITRRLAGEAPAYKCRQCGFAGRTLHWQCPRCRNWNTVKPLQGVGIA